METTPVQTTKSYWYHTGKSLPPRSDIGLNTTGLKTTPMANASMLLYATLKCQRLSWIYSVRFSSSPGRRVCFLRVTFTLEIWLTLPRKCCKPIISLIKLAFVETEDVKTICGAIKSRNAGDDFIKGLGLVNCFEDGIATNTLKTSLASITSGNAKEVELCLDCNQISSREAAILAAFHLSCVPELQSISFRAGFKWQSVR